jgi:hypothetical protein
VPGDKIFLPLDTAGILGGVAVAELWKESKGK